MHDESGRPLPPPPDDDRTAEPPPRPPWVYSLPAGVLVAVLVLLIAGVVSAIPSPRAAADPTATSSRSPSSAVVVPVTTPPASAAPSPVTGPSVAGSDGRPPNPPPPTAAEQEAERADLAAEAARRTAPVSLTAPREWARSGASPATHAEDIDGCPRLAARLTATLGVRMSYWQGTLPQGPYGCSWVPVPLVDGDPHHAYVLNVGWLDDGTTPARLRSGFVERGGAPCSGVDVPAVGPDAVLVRCEQPTDVEYTLVLRDAAGPGVWLLHAQARTGAPHSAPQALSALIDAVEPAYR